MYQNIWYQKNKNTVHLWDDEKGYLKYHMKKYAYIQDPYGDMVALDGKKVKKITQWSEQDEKSGIIYEQDVNPEARILIDTYTDSDDPSSGHRIFTFDIEVEVLDGFPEPEKAANKITSIAYHMSDTGKYVVLVLDEQLRVDDYETDGCKVFRFSTESELINAFLKRYRDYNPTILTGWNVEFFDVPYLYNRITRIKDVDTAKLLSPIQDVQWNQFRGRYKIAGVSVLDYLALYRKFTFKEQSSYRLDMIGKLEVDMGKIEYQGNLDDLFRDDIEKFIEYNLNDVKIVVALDEKLKFLDLVRGICHKGHVPYEDVFFSSRFLEGAILTYTKRLGVVSTNKKHRSLEEVGGRPDKFTGAYVKEPKPGLYRWIYDLDLTSLYPSIIMSLNISPETKVGKVLDWDVKKYLNKKEDITYETNFEGQTLSLNKERLNDFLEESKFTIASNGCLYRTDDKGLIPDILDKWFQERVEFRKLEKKYGQSGDKEKHQYFKARQYVQKVLLNSLYGVLGLPTFRFYDSDNAEAVTLTGQSLIKYTENMGNFYYQKELGVSDDFCIYIDTDSVFYSALPIVKKRNPSIDENNDELMSKEILVIAKEVQDFMNSSYDMFAKKFLNVTDHRFDIKQEVIAKSGLWVAKKRYAQWIINNNGVDCDELEVKGLDVVRSNFPPRFKKFMSGMLKDILEIKPKNDIDNNVLEFRKNLSKSNIIDIAKPSGLKGLKKYSTKYKKGLFTEMALGTPAHVKAAARYNDLLKYFGHKNVSPLHDGDKLKWVWLKDNKFGIETCALKGDEDDPKDILDFIEENIDYEKIFVSDLKNKLTDFYSALGWGQVPDNAYANAQKFFDF